jgi:hypothetical protein
MASAPKMTASMYNTLSLINPVALPARLFGRDPNVDNDISAVGHVRVKVVMIPWFVLTSLLVILLINIWCA